MAGLWSAKAARTALSRIEAGLGPRRLRVGAAEHDAVVQPEGTVLPELDFERDQPIAAPIRRPRNRAVAEVLGQALDFSLERGARGERPRLARGARADAALATAGGEIGVGLGGRRRLDRPAQANSVAPGSSSRTAAPP